MDVKCPKLKVSGGTVNGDRHVDGTYIITALKAKKSPSTPVYEKQGADKYIFHYPDPGGWRIGPHRGLVSDENSTNVGEYYFKSKYTK